MIWGLRKIKQAHVIIDLVDKRKVRKLAEVGVWRGGTCRTVLRKRSSSIQEYWAIDSWSYLKKGVGTRKEQRVTDEQWENCYRRVCKFMTFFPQLHVLRMSSIEASKLFPKNYFDLVFIDANHRYKFVKADIEVWLPLVREGGFLIGHDYTFGNKYIGVRQAVGESFGEDFKVRGACWIKEI